MTYSTPRVSQDPKNQLSVPRDRYRHAILKLSANLSAASCALLLTGCFTDFVSPPQSGRTDGSGTSSGDPTTDGTASDTTRGSSSTNPTVGSDTTTSSEPGSDDSAGPDASDDTGPQPPECAADNCEAIVQWCTVAPEDCDALLDCSGCPRATHFTPDPISWRVPKGGEPLGGFRSSAGAPVATTMGPDPAEWGTRDLNGDHILDLVRFGHGSEDDPTDVRVFGFESNHPHWLVHFGSAAGFDLEAQEWPIPMGGTSGAGFVNFAGGPDPAVLGPATDEEQAWEMIDLDGDGLLDLTVTARVAVDTDVAADGRPRVFGAPNDRHWRVFLNNGKGFAPDPTPWSLPTLTDPATTFASLQGSPSGISSEAIGEHIWATIDIDGDGLAELVVTASAVERPGFFWWPQVLGYTDTPHWDVYANLGDRFAPSPIHWPVPEGGMESAGFWTPTGSPTEDIETTIGAEAWTVADLDNDGRLDLVITSQAVARPGHNWSLRVFDHGTHPAWKVHRGVEGGFAEAPVSWSVPVGGEYWSGFATARGVPGPSTAPEAVGGEAWDLADITGDGAIDLIVTAHAVERPGHAWWAQVFGHPQRVPQWRIYENDGGGFGAQPTEWDVPLGGEAFGGFSALRGDPGIGAYETIGGQHWMSLDINGDRRLDIAVMSEAQPREGFFWWLEVLGHGSRTPRWDVYLGAP